jgi:hypothetical protein
MSVLDPDRFTVALFVVVPVSVTAGALNVTVAVPGTVPDNVAVAFAVTV